MTKLIFGCSYVDGLRHNELLEIFNDNFINFGMSGCDNKSIYNTLLLAFKNYKPTYVFLVFTGLNRCSYPVSFKSISLYSDYDFKVKIDNEVRLFSGGENGSWSKNKDLIPIFKPTYVVLDDLDHVKQNSLIDCISCINFLEINSIPYNYTFAYNPTSTEFYNYPTWGSVNSDSYYWNLLDKTHYIDNLFLFDYAKNQSLLLKDNFHPNNIAYRHWEDAIKENLYK